VIVVDAVAGVEVQTERMSKLALEYELPRVIFVNRMDRERADFGRTLESVQRRLKGRFVPLQVPIGQETGFGGVVDVVQMKAYAHQDGKINEVPIPEELADTAKEYRDKLVEAVAETDDDLLARYFEEGTLGQEAVIAALRAAIGAGKLVPVLCGSASRTLGVRSLLDLVIDSFPSPADRAPMAGIDPRTKEVASRAPSAKEPFAALVFKTLTDPHVGKLTLFRVFSGTLTANSQVYNATRETRERVGQLAHLQGKEQRATDVIGAGEIGVVLKLKETLTGDTLCAENAPILFPPVRFPEPAISFALQPKAKGDEDKISNALARLAEEDPTLRYHYDPETKQLLISGVGQLHIEVTLERMKRKFNADVALLPPRIPYKETVKGRCQVQGRHKKQTGGRGQFGDCWIEVEPLARGTGFEFVDKIFGGAIPRNFIPSVEKGVRARLERGVIAGYPVVDVRVTLYDGSYHSVDSSDIAFQIAGRKAVREVYPKAKPVVLEPVMKLEVESPSEFQGALLKTVMQRRGTIVGTTEEGGFCRVEAEVPLAEMFGYSTDLRSCTQGKAEFTMEFSRYLRVPGEVQNELIKKYGSRIAKIEED
jgi:elongation factor G